MDKNIFLKEFFFDFKNCFFSDVFNGIESVWEVLPKISEYINSQFKEKVYKCNYKNEKDIFIGEGTIIEEGVSIKGPAIIGKNCFIGHACLVRENCLIGNNVHLGHATEIKNSIFLNGAVAAHLNYIGDSIIGNNVNLAAGVILANFRLDKKTVSIRMGEQRIETHLLKFGSIIGDDSNVGVNSVLNPGTILGKKTIVYPLTSVRGVHQNGPIIK